MAYLMLIAAVIFWVFSSLYAVGVGRALAEKDRSTAICTMIIGTLFGVLGFVVTLIAGIAFGGVS